MDPYGGKIFQTHFLMLKNWNLSVTTSLEFTLRLILVEIIYTSIFPTIAPMRIVLQATQIYFFFSAKGYS